VSDLVCPDFESATTPGVPDVFNPVMNFPTPDYTAIQTAYGSDLNDSFEEIMEAAFLQNAAREIAGSMLNNYGSRMPSDINKILFYAVVWDDLYRNNIILGTFSFLKLTIPNSVTSDVPDYSYQLPASGTGFTLGLRADIIIPRSARIDIGVVFINDTEDTDDASRRTAIDARGRIIKSYNLDENAIRQYGWLPMIADESVLPAIPAPMPFISLAQTYGIDANKRRPRTIIVPDGYSDTNDFFAFVFPLWDAPLTVSLLEEIAGEQSGTVLYDRNHPHDHVMEHYDLDLNGISYRVIRTRSAINTLVGRTLKLRYN